MFTNINTLFWDHEESHTYQKSYQHVSELYAIGVHGKISRSNYQMINLKKRGRSHAEEADIAEMKATIAKQSERHRSTKLPDEAVLLIGEFARPLRRE
jgi:hypothetical protein